MVGGAIGVDGGVGIGDDRDMPSINEPLVTATPAAAPDEALAHFSALLRFETDCWDVHCDMAKGHDAGSAGFVVLDVRTQEAYADLHVPGAVNLPHGRINERNLAEYPDDTVFVVYCAGPHCNGADKAAVRLARLGRPVKKMIGGMEGWRDEGFEFAGALA